MAAYWACRELVVILYLLAAVVVFQLLTNRINLDGLFSNKDGSKELSIERIQLLIATIAAAGIYLQRLAASTPGSLPDIDPQWLYLLGASNGLYVVRKAWFTYTRRQTKEE